MLTIGHFAEVTHLSRKTLRHYQEQLATTRAAVTALRRLLDPAPQGLQVAVRSSPARVVAGIRGQVHKSDVLAWYSGAMAELSALALAETGPYNRSARDWRVLARRFIFSEKGDTAKDGQSWKRRGRQVGMQAARMPTWLSMMLHTHISVRNTWQAKLVSEVIEGEEGQGSLLRGSWA